MISPDASIKAKLHHGIRHVFANVLNDFYVRHPELLNDAKTLEIRTYKTFKLMEAMLAHLNDEEFSQLEDDLSEELEK